MKMMSAKCPFYSGLSLFNFQVLKPVIRENLVNTMAADALASQVGRASAVMLLICRVNGSLYSTRKTTNLQKMQIYISVNLAWQTQERRVLDVYTCQSCQQCGPLEAKWGRHSTPEWTPTALKGMEFYSAIPSEIHHLFSTVIPSLVSHARC